MQEDLIYSASDFFSLSLFFSLLAQAAGSLRLVPARRQVYLQFAEDLSLFLQEYRRSTLGISQSEQTA